jgi:hypothetical protein
MYKGKYVKLVNRYDEKSVPDYSVAYILIFLVVLIILLRLYKRKT